MLTNGVRCAGTDLLIQFLRPGVKYVVRAKSSEAYYKKNNYYNQTVRGNEL